MVIILQAQKQKYLVSKANTQNRDIPALKQQTKTYSCRIEIVSKHIIINFTEEIYWNKVQL